MAKKVYAVRVGKSRGIFDTWDECKAMVQGFKGAEYKSFPTREEAENYLNQKKEQVPIESKDTVIAYVDGSYSKEFKRYAYGCVILYQNERTELKGAGDNSDYIQMRNVAGEITASMKAVEWAITKGAPDIVIYYDYAGIEKWAVGEWKTNRMGTEEYRRFMQAASEKITVHFQKVAAHTGVELNECADQLAKSALAG